MLKLFDGTHTACGRILGKMSPAAFLLLCTLAGALESDYGAENTGC